jgi:hypothetical protein
MKSVSAVVKLKMSTLKNSTNQLGINEVSFVLFISTVLFDAAIAVEIDNSCL